MTTATVLDHVHAYAAAVRDFLADLPREQVDDLTDGLEADLAEALADTPSGADDDASGSRTLDLTRRFGPAAAYAAELRAAAGLAAPAQPGRRVPGTRAGQRLRTWARRRLEPVRTSPYRPAVEAFLRSLTPAWWVVRGWVWFVLAMIVTSPITRVDHVLVPAEPAAGLLLAALVVLSVNIGRGVVRLGPTAVRAARVASIAAVVAVLPAGLNLHADAVAGGRPGWGLYGGGGSSGYAEPSVQDGVVVDGVAVSNLYVYDADGEPLTDVQIFDDRGRPVRTTFDDGWEEWYLAEVEEPWRFVPARDADGRDRWNVFPLRGGPIDRWTYDAMTGVDRIVEPELPPFPFAKAPSLERATTAGPDADGAVGAPGGVAGGSQDAEVDGRAGAGPEGTGGEGPGGDEAGRDEAGGDETGSGGGAADGAGAAEGDAVDGGAAGGAVGPDGASTPPAGTELGPVTERRPVSVEASAGAG